MISVDVIVPCYRYGHFLKQCVESALNQSGVHVRVLVIDDASPDSSAEVAEKLAQSDGRVTFVRHAANRGHIATYNEGIEWTSSDYLLLLSADDYLLPGALERATSLMEREPNVGFAFGNATVLFDDGTTEPVYPMGRLAGGSDHYKLSGAEFIARSGATNIVPTPSAVVRTELQKRAGGYRQDLPHSGDMEMWLRLAARAQVGFVNHNQAVYRRHTSNMSQMYTSDVLPDLKQRKAALDSFLKDSSSTLPNAIHLYNRALGALGRDAIGRASGTFNNGLLALSDQILQYAVDACPETKNSWPWVKLACKRALGFERWQALHSVQHAISKWNFKQRGAR